MLQGDRPMNPSGSWVWDVLRNRPAYWSDEMCCIHGRHANHGVPTVDEYRAMHSPEEWAEWLSAIEKSTRDGTQRTWPLRDGKVSRKNGVTYITSGGGGGRLEEAGPLPTWFKAQLRVDYHCCYVNIQGGRFEFKAFDHNSQLFDSFEIEK